MKLALHSAPILVACFVSVAIAEERKGEFSVHDVSVWILDGGRTMANSHADYQPPFPSSTPRPQNVATRAIGKQLAPLGLITFYGRPAQELDIDLRLKSGSFRGHWPAGEMFPNRVRWAGSPAFDLVEKVADPSELSAVDLDHWMHKARDGDALFVRHGARSERFLAYDAALNLAAPVRLEGGPEKYTLANTAGVDLHDVLVSRGTPQGRRIAWLDVLPKAAPGVELFGTKPPALVEPKPNQPNAEKVPTPAAKAGRTVDIEFSEPLPADSPQAAEKTVKELAARLAKAGLKPAEIALFTQSYAPLLFQGESIVVAFRLDKATIDENLPLSIFPEPAEIVRVPIVIVHNADPALLNEVDSLIAQLGDPKYSVRQAAQAKLNALGPPAFSALQKATAHADPEIAIRAERILLNQNQNPTGQAPQPQVVPATKISR